MAADAIAPLLPRTLVLVAHQDDEAAGCGALMQRMREPLLVFATNGAPRDNYFWQRYGSREEYARIRRQEALHAASASGIERIRFLDFADQELHQQLPQALIALDQLVQDYRPSAILTLAYEGGHPDHDCCAFLSWVLFRRHSIPVWEMPLYHRVNGVPVIQQFLSGASEEHRLHVTTEELARKRVMFASYVSQGIVLSHFDLTLERFRRQAEYDFSRPPHEGLLNYEAWEWPMKGEDLCNAFSAVIKQL
jgi:N-acetylglucosamine malate deacetylase 2